MVSRYYALAKDLTVSSNVFSLVDSGVIYKSSFNYNLGMSMLGGTIQDPELIPKGTIVKLLHVELNYTRINAVALENHVRFFAFGSNTYVEERFTGPVSDLLVEVDQSAAAVLFGAR